MTSPDFASPAPALTATLLTSLQDATKEGQAAQKNLDLRTALEDVRTRLHTDLLGGFTNVPAAIMDGLTALIEAITNVAGGDFSDLEAWAAGLRDVVATLVDKLLDALGIPKLGSLADRILDLGDGMAELHGGVTGLFDTIGGVVGASVHDVETRLAEFLTGNSPLNASKLTGAVSATLIAGVLDIARIPNLAASKITSGTFGTSLIPSLDASKIASGVLGAGLIPLLDQSKVSGLPALSTTVGGHTTSITDLQSRTQALQGVIGYGCRYMSSSPGVTTSPSVMPFDTQVGPAVGVTLSSGGRFTLGSKGLWELSAQVRFWGAKFAPPKCFMDIVVRDGGGTEIARIKSIQSSEDELTIPNSMPVVIPAAGCTVEVQAWTSAIAVIGGNWRGIGGGYSTTRFWVNKISDETS
ncbi:MAG: hypothetical protein QM658_09655 [Gordonia sp. (in: high G+C Gram-positive bacteria)]